MIESALQGLRVELASLQAARPTPPVVSRASIVRRVDELAALATQDPVRARMGIRKHLDGDLELVPLASDGTVRQIELHGRVKPNSLLVAQEAVGGVLARLWLRKLDCRMLHGADDVVGLP